MTYTESEEEKQTERGHTQREDTKIEGTAQGRDYTDREKGKQEEKTTRKGDYAEKKERTYMESLEKTQKGDYIERGLHGEGRGIQTEMEHTQRRSNHGVETKQRGDYKER